MNDLNDEVFKILKTLEAQGALSHLVVIGSWATVFYQDYFKDSNFHPTIRTTDIDFLIPKKPPNTVHIDISKGLKELGFMEQHEYDGWVTFHKPDLHIEFISPRKGPQSDEPKSFPSLGVNTRPLRFMTDLMRDPIQCSYKGINVTLPHPVSYGIHKLIISCERKQDFKRGNDREQAEMVLTAISSPEEMLFLKTSYDRLFKSEKNSIREAIKDRPILKEIFGRIIEKL